MAFTLTEQQWTELTGTIQGIQTSVAALSGQALTPGQQNSDLRADLNRVWAVVNKFEEDIKRNKNSGNWNIKDP